MARLFDTPTNLMNVTYSKKGSIRFLVAPRFCSKRFDFTHATGKTRAETPFYSSWSRNQVRFFHTGVRRRKYKLGQPKQILVEKFASFDQVYNSSSAPQCERIGRRGRNEGWVGGYQNWNFSTEQRLTRRGSPSGVPRGQRPVKRSRAALSGIGLSSAAGLGEACPCLQARPVPRGSRGRAPGSGRILLLRKFALTRLR